MEIEDELFLDDDVDILEIIEFGFPRRINQRQEYFESMDNMSFFRRFRLTKETVLMVLGQIEEDLEFDNDLNRSISPMNQLLTTLRFYACGGHQIGIGDFIGMHQSTTSRIIRRVSQAIARLRERYIKMPEPNELIQVGSDFHEIARFPRVIGCLDGTHIKIQSPGGQDAEVFRNRKSYFSINTQVVCDSHLKIIDVVARWPGSAHDLTIFNNSRIRARFEAGEFPDNCVILGDSGYVDRSYLMIPLANPVTRGEQLYNESQIRTRNTVERQIGVWKRRFPILAYGMRCHLNTSLTIIVATAVLHNIAIIQNEHLPPPPENLDQHHLDYLIQLGNVPNIPLFNINNVNQPINYRRHLIDNYFAQL